MPVSAKKSVFMRTKSMLNVSEEKHKRIRSMTPIGSGKNSEEDEELKLVASSGLVSNAPARELHSVWNKFTDNRRNDKILSPLIQTLKNEGHFLNITVLTLENHKLERIFEYIKPCINLIALYLKGNCIIIRDFNQISSLVNLR